MAAVKTGPVVDGSAWNDLMALAGVSHRSTSELLTEAIRDQAGRRRLGPEVLRHLETSIRDDEKPGRLPARWPRAVDGPRAGQSPTSAKGPQKIGCA